MILRARGSLCLRQLVSVHSRKALGADSRESVSVAVPSGTAVRWPGSNGSRQHNNYLRIATRDFSQTPDPTPLLRQQIKDLASQPATPVSLQALYQYGSDRSSLQHLKNAQFLHHVLPIRFAQRVEELYMLPYGLSKKKPTQEVRRLYADHCKRLLEFPRPHTPEEQQEFCELMSDIMNSCGKATGGVGVVQTMATGVLELRMDLQEQGLWDKSVRKTLDNMLDRFYMARIGMRFIMDQYLQSQNDTQRDGFSGIIENKCSPMEVARQAAYDAASLCEAHCGDAPDVVFHGSTDTFTYIPEHLYYMLFELLKNSMRATMEVHKDNDAYENHPVSITTSIGEEDVTIKVSDLGGGIPRSEVDLLWTYMHTTAETPVLTLNGNNGSGRNSSSSSSSSSSGSGSSSSSSSSSVDMGAPGSGRAGGGLPPLAGFGVGLPMSRLYARYFGGDLDIKSMEGWGTDCYLHLNKLSDNCENLPSVVRYSPGERDSSPETKAKNDNNSETGITERLGDVEASNGALLRRVAELERRLDESDRII